MLLSRLFAAGLWLAATVASTAMVWAATSIVAADVTDRPPSVIPHREVMSELASGPAAAETPPTTTAPTPQSPPSTVPTRGRGPVPASPDAPVPDAAPSETPQPGFTTAPFSAPPTTAAPPTGTPPEPRPTSPADPRPTATYSTSGGVVRVACSGFFIELISAIPANGYVADVVASGPGNVDVRFVGPGPDVSVKAVCFGQPIRYYEQSPPRRAPGSS